MNGVCLRRSGSQGKSLSLPEHVLIRSMWPFAIVSRQAQPGLPQQRSQPPVRYERGSYHGKQQTLGNGCKSKLTPKRVQVERCLKRHRPGLQLWVRGQNRAHHMLHPIAYNMHLLRTSQYAVCPQPHHGIVESRIGYPVVKAIYGLLHRHLRCCAT